MARRRPSRHIRRIRTRKGVKRRMINPHISPRRQIVKRMTSMHPEIKATQASHLVDMTFEGIGDSLRSGNKFTQPKFGTFSIKIRKARKARMGLRPGTNEKMMWKAKPAMKIIKFRPAKQLKNSVK